jgi:farnesyl-diphosphate farnesyltransferase
MAERTRWINRAEEWLAEGFVYADALALRRLRAASVLPAMLGRETLALLRGAPFQTRVKVPRSRVYPALLRAFVGRVH